jgi:hypothetical protein
VACAFVVGTDITETDDKEFFHRKTPSPLPLKGECGIFGKEFLQKGEH